MKAKTFLLGLVFFVIGMVVTFGIGSNHMHHNYNKNKVEVRKSTVIEVGAPLTVKELKEHGFNYFNNNQVETMKSTVIEVGAPLTVTEL
jgi:hypothetical protein